MTRHSERIARELGLPQELVAKVRIAAAVHDVGKIKTPREVLTKPGRLDDSEFEIIKQHPVDGAAMVLDLGDDEITAMVRHHHERLDGTGYPDRLAGDEIPLGARIIAVADTFDAMTSSRPYRAACKHKKALDVLAKEAGAQLDPAPVAAFMRYYSGKRSVGWTALAAAAPQRLGAWLGGVFQNIGAGIAPTLHGLAAVGAAGVIGAGLGGAAESTSAKVARQQPVQAAEASDPGRRNSEDRGAASAETERRAPGSGDDRGTRDRRGRSEQGAPNGTDGPRAGDPRGDARETVQAATATGPRRRRRDNHPTRLRRRHGRLRAVHNAPGRKGSEGRGAVGGCWPDLDAGARNAAGRGSQDRGAVSGRWPDRDSKDRNAPRPRARSLAAIRSACCGWAWAQAVVTEKRSDPSQPQRSAGSKSSWSAS